MKKLRAVPSGAALFYHKICYKYASGKQIRHSWDTNDRPATDLRTFFVWTESTNAPIVLDVQTD